jgi:hypothetical protein
MVDDNTVWSYGVTAGISRSVSMARKITVQLPSHLLDKAQRSIPHLDVLEGYWERAGSLRAKLVRQKRRAPLADTLIAQSCLDHDVALVTRDADFRYFARVSGLRVLLESASS